MKSAQLTAFFSCSFAEEDQPVNEYFRAIAEGLDVSCTNVSTGYVKTPPQQALEMIKESDVVIVIATPRTELAGSEESAMSAAVSHELAFAFGEGKPLLLLRESKVRADGFLNNYGTSLQFDRTDLQTAEFLKKAIAAIHNLKLGAVSEHQLTLSQEITEFVAERTSHLYELEREGNDFCWQHSIERRIRFTKPYNKPLKLTRWNDFIPEPPEGTNWPPMELCFEINGSSRPFEFTIEHEKTTSVGITANVKLSPPPAADDWIDYFVSFRGPYLAVVYSDDITSAQDLKHAGRTYNAFDGNVPVNRVKEMEIQFRFPRDYRLSPSDAVFFIEKGKVKVKVKVTVLSDQGKEAVIAFLGTGDFIGEASLPGQPRRITPFMITTYVKR